MTGRSVEAPPQSHRGHLRAAGWLTIAILTAACTAGATPPRGASTSAPAARIGSATACPSRPPDPFPQHQRAGTDTAEVPGSPVTLLACRYHGFNQPEPMGTLARSATFPPTLASALNQARAAGPLYGCPEDSGETILLIFGYADGSRLLVDVHTRGCRTATNGDRTVVTPDAVLSELEEILGQDPT